MKTRASICLYKPPSTTMWATGESFFNIDMKVVNIGLQLDYPFDHTNPTGLQEGNVANVFPGCVRRLSSEDMLI